jgi:aspartyl-tRNA(Asn)/glutamyl-tRNA(Gln) amidotransferase subunit A
LTKSVHDASLVLEVIAGPDGYDSTLFDEPYQGAIPATPVKKLAYFDVALNHPGLDAGIREHHLSYYQKLREQGYDVEAVSFDLLEFLVPTYYILTTAEASSNLGRFDGLRYGYRSNEKPADLLSFYKKNRSEGFGVEVQRRILSGSFVLSAGYFDAYYVKAQQVRKQLYEKALEIFSQYDALLMPNSPVTAFKLGEKMSDPLAMYLADIYTVFANLAGLPAISLPLFTHSNGLPVGLQVLMAPGKDAELLALSGELVGQ